MLTRWRHSHGFGVHSPFAYRIITDAIRLKKEYAFYGDAEIRRLCRRRHLPSHLGKEARILLRLAVFLDIRSVWISRKAPEVIAAALKGANSRMRFEHNPSRLTDCDLLLVNGSDKLSAKSSDKSSEKLSAKALAEFIALPGKTLLIKDCPADLRELLYESMPEGIMLEGKSSTLLFSRPQTQKLRYLSSL